MAISESILEKIKKLQRLSKSSNPHEAALAAARIQEILTKYNIEQLNLITPNEEESIIAESIGDKVGRLSAWIEGLMVIIAKHNNCIAYRQKYETGKQVRKTTLRELIVVGTKDDIDATHYLYAFCVSEIERLTLSLARGKGRVYANQFRLGVVDAIEKMLKEEKKKSLEWAKAQGYQNALVKIEQKNSLVQQFLAKLNLSNVQRGSFSEDVAARSHGFAAGQNIKIANDVSKGLPSPTNKLKDS